MWKPLAAVRDNPAVQIALLCLYALLCNRDGSRVPASNELVYLLYVYRAWHPHFLEGDWTFLEPTAGHSVFNHAVGWLTLVMPLEWLGWIGRLSCWALAFVGILRVGRHFKLPSWAVFLGVALWLLERQSFVSLEWVIATFEAKCIAYIFLFFAIDAGLRGRLAWAVR